MHGCICRALVCCVLLLGVAGCDQLPPPAAETPRPSPEPVPVGPFDAVNSGIIRGRVSWRGDVPTVPPLRVRSNPFYGGPLKEDRLPDNPNAPVVDRTSRGVGNAVVFLRGVDAAKARPWHHAPLRIEQRDAALHILQGDSDSRVGFVRQNGTVELVSKDPWLHMLRASGAAFFTLAFPDPEQPLTRRLTKKGIVELTSGCGYYWMRAYLFVDDHPYYARTDKRGRFVLEQVPPGRYQLVCWTPNWLKVGHERDPESGLIVRYFFRPPLQQEREIVVPPAGIVNTDFSVSTAAYLP
jgi:hypothetical protein